MEIVFEPGERRAGRPLIGHLKLDRKAQLGDVFVMRVSCTRRYRSGRAYRTERAFLAEQRVRAVAGHGGLSAPFRFEIPAYAPASATGLGAQEGYRWSMEVLPDKGWWGWWGHPHIELTLSGAPRSEIQALEAGEVPDVRTKIDAIVDDLASMGQKVAPR